MAIIVAVPVGIIGCLAAASSRIRADARGVRIYTILGPRSWHWQEIESFVADTRAVGLVRYRRRVLGLRLRSGQLKWFEELNVRSQPHAGATQIDILAAQLNNALAVYLGQSSVRAFDLVRLGESRPAKDEHPLPNGGIRFFDPNFARAARWIGIAALIFGLFVGPPPDPHMSLIANVIKGTCFTLGGLAVWLFARHVAQRSGVEIAGRNVIIYRGFTSDVIPTASVNTVEPGAYWPRRPVLSLTDGSRVVVTGLASIPPWRPGSANLVNDRLRRLTDAIFSARLADGDT